MWKRVAIVFIIAILAFVFFGIMTKGRGWNRGVRAVLYPMKLLQIIY